MSEGFQVHYTIKLKKHWFFLTLFATNLLLFYISVLHIPIGSMYGIFTYFIYHYSSTIHGSVNIPAPWILSDRIPQGLEKKSPKNKTP